jgi:dephospho-CoA kinase
MIMKKIGITGGYGSGKSTAAKYFSESGYPVIYTDPLAKKLMSENAGIRDALVRLLGSAAYLDTGSIDIRYISEIIFTDPARKRELERIVHPAVVAAVTSDLADLERSKRYTVAFVEAPLLFESGLHDKLDYVVAVLAARSDRIARIVGRDGLPEPVIEKRIDAQQPDEFFRLRADFVIENNAGIDELHGRCAFLLRLFDSLEQ